MRILNTDPTSTDIRPLINAVLRHRPDLAGQPISIPSQGNASWAAFIGDEVFKTPRGEDFLPAFEREAGIQVHLQGKTRITIPLVTFTKIDHDDCLLGMRRLSGVHLKYERLKELSDTQQTQIARDIADFISDMRSAFAPQDIQSLGIKTATDTTIEPFMAEMVKTSLDDLDVKNLLGKDILRNAYDVVDNFSALLPLSEDNHILHGDISAGNMLFDPSGGRLTGIIDFGSVSIHPIEYDLMRMNLPMSCIRQVVDFYMQAGGRNIDMNTVLTLRHAHMINAIKNMARVERFKKMRDRIIFALTDELGSPPGRPARLGTQPVAQTIRNVHGS